MKRRPTCNAQSKPSFRLHPITRWHVESKPTDVTLHQFVPFRLKPIADWHVFCDRYDTEPSPTSTDVPSTPDDPTVIVPWTKRLDWTTVFGYPSERRTHQFRGQLWVPEFWSTVIRPISKSLRPYAINQAQSPYYQISPYPYHSQAQSNTKDECPFATQ
jgi:hypothetical protein